MHYFICLNIPHSWTCDNHNTSFDQDYHYEAVQYNIMGIKTGEGTMAR